MVKPSSLGMARAKASRPELVQLYFSEMSMVQEKYDLVKKPHLIFNIDEVGFNCEHKPVKIVAGHSCRRPQSIVSPRSAMTTVLCCGNAAGDSLPPFFIHKGKQCMDTLKAGALPGT